MGNVLQHLLAAGWFTDLAVEYTVEFRWIAVQVKGSNVLFDPNFTSGAGVFDDISGVIVSLDRDIKQKITADVAKKAAETPAQPGAVPSAPPQAELGEDGANQNLGASF